MGVEIQSKRNSTGCCSIWGPHKHAKNDIWSLFQDDRPQKNGQYFESLLPWHLKLDGCLDYEKEKVKQTILKHESTFRQQLQELHRLYGKQRELMNGFRRRDVKPVRIEEEASRSSPFSSHISPEDTKHGWHVSHVPSMQLVFGQSSHSEFSCKQSFSGFSKEKSTMLFPSRDSGSSKICELPSSKGKLSPRKVIDLEIPADACTNNEATYSEEIYCELPRVESNSNTCTEEILHSTGVRISFCSALNDHQHGDVSRPSLPFKRRNELADLNEPILLEETSFSGSADDPADLSSHWGNIKSEDKSATPNSVLNPLSKDTSLSSRRNNSGGNCFKSFQSMNEMDKKERLTCDFKSKIMQPDSLCMSRDVYSKNSSVAFQSSKDGHKKLDEISPSEQNRMGHRTKRKLFGVDIFEVNDQSLVTGAAMVHPATKFDKLVSKQSFLHVKSGVGASARPFQSSMDGVSYKSGLPLNSQLNADSSQRNLFANFNFINNTTTFEFVREESTTVDLEKSDERLDSLEWKPAKVSGTATNTANVFEDVFATEYNILPADCQSKQKFPMELPLHRMDNIHCAEQPKANKNYYHLNLDSLQKCSQQFFKNSTSLSSEKLIQKTEKMSPILIHDVDDSNIEVHLPSSTKIKDISPSSKQGISGDIDLASKSSEPTCSADDGYNDGDVSREKVVSEHHPRGKCLNLEEPIYNIDLNLSLVEEEAPSSPCLPTAVVKLAITELELEAPIVHESEAGKQTELSSADPEEPFEELIKLAAEAIVAISMPVGEDIVDDSTCESVQDGRNECLQWFVDVVSSYECHDQSNISDVNLKGNDGLIVELIPDGMDDFEYMTLKLEDIKDDECCHNYSAPVMENQEDEEAQVGTLSKRPRRGQARRGRQRKDFQRDVLPSLISLSKLEVTEDFQAFEELLKASGSTWPSSLSRRSTAKSSRGRRRVGAKAVQSPSEHKPVSREAQPEDKTLTGWGKKTRRLPRQRHVTGTNN